VLEWRVPIRIGVVFGPEHHGDLDRYSRDFAFARVEYLEYEEGFLFDSYRGVALTPTAAFGRHQVCVAMAGLERSETRCWSADEWSANERKVLRSQYFAFKPATVSIYMAYPGTDWRKDIGTWTVR
jgi:hypothetical protein